MRFPLISLGNSHHMILGASKSAVLGFGKRGAGKQSESKAQGHLAERTASLILAITDHRAEWVGAFFAAGEGTSNPV